jgi:PAS domain S-box-containing protein
MPTSSSEGELLVGGRPAEPAPSTSLSADERSTLAALACGVLILDASGAVVYANAAAERLLGVTSAQLRGRVPLGALWTATDADGQPVPEAESPPILALRTGRPVLGRVLSFAGPDGERRWTEMDARPGVDADGRVVRVVATLVDAGARQALERQVTALGRLEPMRQLGEMAGGIAHDVNHYLTLVAGHAEIARQVAEAQGSASPELCDALDTIVRAAMEGAAATRRLQTFGRPARAARPTRLVVGDLVREVALMTQPKWRDKPQAEGRPIQVQLEVEGDTTITGVEQDLREALTNLVFNAVDAMPKGGTMVLSAKRLGAEVHVDVADTGTGMPPDVQARIFEPYFTTKGERGTGLGLSVVQAMVQGHAGRVQVRSTPALGTVFRLSFPAAAPQAAAPPPVAKPAEAAPRPVTPMRVLAVDDERDLTDLVATMLARDGHTVVAAHSGEEALVRLADTPFDLVITDLTMDGMNGWELIAAIRERYRGVRIVLATGWGAEIDPAVARARGVDVLIAKPYRLDSLRKAVAGPG